MDSILFSWLNAIGGFALIRAKAAKGKAEIKSGKSSEGTSAFLVRLSRLKPNQRRVCSSYLKCRPPVPSFSVFR